MSAPKLGIALIGDYDASVKAVATAFGLLVAIVLGLSAGAMLAEAAVLVPYWRSLAPAVFLAWYRENAALLFNFFAPLEIAGAVLALTAAVLYRMQRRVGGGSLIIAAVLAVAVLATFPIYFERVNASFAEGTIGIDQVAGELARWANWHWMRTTIGIMAFIAAILGARDGRAGHV